jgi:hypothetical protein
VIDIDAEIGLQEVVRVATDSAFDFELTLVNQGVLRFRGEVILELAIDGEQLLVTLTRSRNQFHIPYTETSILGLLDVAFRDDFAKVARFTKGHWVDDKYLGRQYLRERYLSERIIDIAGIVELTPANPGEQDANVSVKIVPVSLLKPTRRAHSRKSRGHTGDHNAKGIVLSMANALKPPVLAENIRRFAKREEIFIDTPEDSEPRPKHKATR